ncbi:MAG: hypothetical protein LBQ60_22115 [Bacteroidales bacterium]|jgi:hypothetical protein|nr:hypothetical protein [Bacteroidales bacterium]
MKKLIILPINYCFILISLVSCNNKLPERDDAIIRFDNIYSDYISIDTLHFTLETNIKENHTTEMGYHYINGNLRSYIIDTALTRLSFKLNGEEQNFVFLDFKIFKTREKQYTVYKFASNFKAEDGCINHFYVPDFGIILTSSRYWGSYEKLWINNMESQQEIDNLIELIILNYKFYYGCVDNYGQPEKLILHCYDETIPDNPPDSTLNIFDLLDIE